MGRPPTHGAPSFRFHAAEVAQMESILREHAGNVPPRDFLVSLASQFSNSLERAGKSIVQMKQVWNWFQNRRYALRSKLVKPPGNPNFLQGEVAPSTNLPQFPQQAPMPSGHNVVRNASENPPMEFEAKSARDGAWYDVQQFLSHRFFDTGNPEVLVRFAGFGQEEDEWVDVAKHVRHRSLPCESSECIVVLPGDLILCFQEGKEQALYFDAHVLDAQRRRHDVRGCRCRFLVRYDHDQSEEIVPLRKICRRPETDYRLQLLHSTNESVPASSGPADSKNPAVDPASTSTLRAPSSNPLPSHNTVVNPTAVPPTLSPATAASASISVPSLTSNFALTQAPALGHAPALGQVQAPAPAPAPSQTLAAASTQGPAQGPILLSGEAPGSSLTPFASATPSPILTSDSATQILYPTPVSVQSSIPVRAPEVRKIESDSPAASSAGVASACESIVNPSAASVIMEVKMEEISIPKTSSEVPGGRSVSQGDASENP